MTVNDPDDVQIIAVLHDGYERALADNDVTALNGYFWDSPHVVRYGVAEQLYGTDELHAYRQGATPRFTNRRVVRRVIATFGATFATVMAEVEMLIGGARRHSRQSQTWVLIPAVGWRIVAAHVSAPLATAETAWPAYADLMAGRLGLTLAGDQRAGVAANLERTAAITTGLLAWPLGDEVEPAPVFTA